MSHIKLIEEKPNEKYRTKFKAEIDLNNLRDEIEIEKLIVELERFSNEIYSKDLPYDWLNHLIKIIKREI